MSDGKVHCPLCDGTDLYSCLTKNRLFCWTCGHYFGSCH